jgi:hypothetical protein
VWQEDSEFQVNLGYTYVKTKTIVIIRKMPHTAHKGGSREVSHVQKYNKQAGWPRRKNGAALFSWRVWP